MGILRNYNFIVCFRSAGLLGVGFIFLILTTVTFEVRTSSQVITSGLSGIAVKLRLFEDVFAFLIVVFFILKRGKLYIPFGKNVIIWLYVFACLLSTFYSVSKVATLGKAFELFLAVLYVLVALQYSYNRLISLICIYVNFLLLSIILSFVGFILKLPGFVLPAETGWSYLMGGKACTPYLSPNGLGYASATLFSLFLVRFYYERTSANFIGLLLSLLGVFISGSRTSLGIIFIIIMVFFYFRNRKLFLLVVPFLIISLYGFKDKLLSILVGEQTIGNFLTLSGRLILWEYAFQFFERRPFLGYGFGIGSRYLFASERIPGFEETISTVHNGILEVLLGLGVIGGIIFFLMLILFLVESIKTAKNPTHPLHDFFLLFVPITIASIMSVGVGGAFSFFFFFTISILFGSDYLRRWQPR